MSERDFPPPTPLPAPQDGADPKMWRRFISEQNLKGNENRSYVEFVQRHEENRRQRDEDAAAKVAAKASAKAAKASAAVEARSSRVAVNLFEGLDLGSVTDLASSLPPEWQPEFRREVTRTKAYIARFADADPSVPLVEEYVFLKFVARAVSIGIMAGRFDKKTAETVDILLKRRTEMAQVLGLTPQEKRKRGGSTESTISAALEASQKAVAVGRTGRQTRRDHVAQMLDEKVRDAARSPTQETGDGTES